MLVNKFRLIELLNHPDGRVVNAAGDALERFFWDRAEILGALLNVLEGEHKRETKRDLSLSHRLPSFPATEKDLPTLTRLLTALDGKKDDESEELAWNIKQVLLYTPFPLIQAKRHLFSSHITLMDIYEETRQRDRFRLMAPDRLWQIFKGQFFHSFQKGEAKRHEIAHSLVNFMVQKGDAIKPYVTAIFKKNKIDDDTMEEYLIEVVGKLKLTELAPFLFDILRNSDPMDIIHQECIRYLGMLGTPKLVQHIERRYIMDEDSRAELAQILGYIPHYYSEELCMKLLGNETNVFHKTYLACSLCDLFSLKGSGTVLEIIKKRNYDPMVCLLLTDLVPVYAYHHIPQIALEALEADDLKFRQGIQDEEFEPEWEDDEEPEEDEDE
ncbi:MAG: HEAT repeat domain-containing protein [Candidatus Omnitrophota bacterium]